MDTQFFTPADMFKASKFCKHEYKTLALHSATQIDYQGYCIVTLPDTLGGNSFVMETSDSGHTWYYYCESESEYIDQHMAIPDFTHYEVINGYSDQQCSYEMKFPKVNHDKTLMTVNESDYDTPQDMIAFLRNQVLKLGLNNLAIGYVNHSQFCLYIP